MKASQEEIIESLKYHAEEDFHYCFDGYSRWEEVKDEKFQELLQNYLDSRQKLQGYIPTL
jgi:hypothetical protein